MRAMSLLLASVTMAAPASRLKRLHAHPLRFTRAWPSGATPSLRVILALALGALGLLSTVTLAAFITREATARLEAEVGAQLGELAEHTARSLDQGMFERWADMQIAASNDTLRDPAASVAEKQSKLALLQRTYPAYAIILLANPAGRIITTSSGLLVGADVGRRDYFLAGREGPFVGNVHDAILLAKLLPGRASEPLRLVDLATPVRDKDGALVGVLAAHLDWVWARELTRTLALSLKGRREGAEILVLGKDGTVLIGPAALQDVQLSPQTLLGAHPVDAQGSARVGRWPDGEEEFVSAVHATSGYRDYPGLGWRVVVRHRASRALASVTDLRRNVLAAGGTVALGSALLGWFMAAWIAHPLRDIARAAGALGRNEPLPVMPSSVVSEGRQVAEALGAAAAELRQREEARRLLIDELNHRVKNTLATVQSIAAQSLKGLGDGAVEGRQAFDARLFALSRTHNVLTRESWGGAELGTLVAEAIRPFRGEEAARLSVDGPPVRVAPQTALSLTMVLHELCTNAAKYGALSNAAGQVEIRWSLHPDEAGRRLCLTWRERGGPLVGPPARKGFGSRLIERGLAGPVEGQTTLAFEPDGLVCVLGTTLEAEPSRAFA